MEFRKRIQPLVTLALVALLATLVAGPATPVSAKQEGNQRDKDWTGGGGDFDEDGVRNRKDNCWKFANEDQADLDGDGVGDLCDPDRDGDHEWNDDDNCPDIRNTQQEDQDDDGTGDFCDSDIDGDGMDNSLWTMDPRRGKRGSKKSGKGQNKHVDVMKYVFKGDDNCALHENPDQPDRDELSFFRFR